jgi:aldehyde dehydrogenase (NAD+)
MNNPESGGVSPSSYKDFMHVSGCLKEILNMKECQLFINGQWINTESGKIDDDINPATGEIYARVHMAGVREVEDALSAAKQAFPAWSAMLADQREKILLKAADCLANRTGEAVEILIEEGGSTITKARAEVMGSIGTIRVAAGECRRVNGEILQPTSQNQISLAVRVPLGVISGIAPFNYPLLLALKKVSYALAAGNTFVLKPASVTPLSGYIIAKIFEEAGLPAGVLNVIPGPGAVVGDKLVEDPRVKAVTFTGSSEVGRKIASKAAYNLKRYAMELGGKNPLIVLADYNVDLAVEIAGYGAFCHQGQVCMASSRIIVEKPVYEEFCKKMTFRAKSMKVGDPHDENTIIGPLINEKQREIIDAQVKDAVSKGAKLLTGGTYRGPYYQPTVLAGVNSEMGIFYEESFGPVTSIVCAENADDALAICNDNQYGLSSALLTNDLKKAFAIGMKIEAGKVHVNDTTFVSSTTAPSGGTKLSGIGKEGGRYSIEDFTELKWITVQYADKKMPF